MMPNLTLEIQESDDMKTLLTALTLANPRKKCDVCGAMVPSAKIRANKDKEGNIYINNYCQCGAFSKLGTYKDKSGYFWREFEAREKKN